MAEVYQIKISIKYSKPPIWRRLMVEPTMTLSQLHRLIQVSMDWNCSHLHKFEYNLGKRGFGTEARDESKTIKTYLKEPKDKIAYEYDFGDSWEHMIELEKVEPRENGKSYPYCVTGRMVAPIDDCGGTEGFYDLLEALEDKSHSEHASFLDWVGIDLAERLLSNHFDKNEINERIGAEFNGDSRD